MIFPARKLVVTLSLFSIWIPPATAEIRCLGTPSADAGARLSALLVCPPEEEMSSDCRPYSGEENLKLKESSRLNLFVREASIKKGEYGEIVLRIDLDEPSTCWFHKLTAEHIGEKLALVHNGKILIVPTIMEGIPGGQIHVTQGYGATPEGRVALCRSITPNCRVETALSLKDRILKFFKNL